MRVKALALLLPVVACSDAADPGPEPLQVLDIQAGGHSTCAIMEGGALWCWGMGVQPDEVNLVPARAAEGLTVKAVSIAYASACALTETGATYCWGNWFPIDSPEPYGEQPTLIQDSIPLDGLDTYGFHTCGVAGVEGILCWGSNVMGRRGQGTPVEALGSTTPNFVAGSAGFRAVATGRSHTCAILADEGVACWGSAEDLGATGPAVVEGADACFFEGASCAWSPVRLPLSNVEQLGLGNGFSCARSGGEVHCWGVETTPTVVALPEAAVDVAVGGTHACAVGASGEAYCWGTEGPWLGHDGSGDQPTAVAGDVRFERLSLGQLHSCGLTTGGEIYCWGRGDLGQLGNGGSVESFDPVLVTAAWEP